MGQRHLHMFRVGYTCVQGSLVLDVVSLLLRSPEGSWGGVWLSLNTILLFYQDFLTRYLGIILRGHM